MTYFNVSYAATKSLHAIDDWLSTCQANLTGSVRNSFKESNLTYAGSNTIINRTPKLAVSGEMIAEQTLKTGDTRVDWKQGDIVDSTEDTHFAIQGDGFFIVTDPKTTNYGIAPLYFGGNTTAGAQKAYLTRDGEFHWAVVTNSAGANIGTPITGVANEQVLCNQQGLVVVGDYGGNSDDWHAIITKTGFYDPVNPEKPSVVQPSKDVAFNTGYPGTIIDYNEIQYSKYGSTIYDAPTANSYKTIINGGLGNFDRRDEFPPGPISGSLMRQKSLEAANTDTARNLTEMSALGKMYNGFVQLIKAYNGTLDEILGFIR
jgi:flagellar hook protein FlgE